MNPGSITVKHKVTFGRVTKGRKTLQEARQGVSLPVGRAPRLARLLALAIRFDELIRTGKVRSYAELARVGGVSRARLTQIMNLLNLALDVQQKILDLPPDVRGGDVLHERQLRLVASPMNWRTQCRRWQCINP